MRDDQSLLSGTSEMLRCVVSPAEWIYRCDAQTGAVLEPCVHVVAFGIGYMARCKCGLVLYLGSGVKVQPPRGNEPRVAWKCQGCWGIRPVPAPKLEGE